MKDEIHGPSHRRQDDELALPMSAYQRWLMSLSKRNLVVVLMIGLTCLSCRGFVPPFADQTKRSFTIADDAQIAVFGGSSGTDEELLFSPDGKYFLVETERGRLDRNDVEDSLRFYRCTEIQEFLEQPDGLHPVWTVNRSSYKGRAIKAWHWLPDSSAIAFLERTSGDDFRLVLADLTKMMVEPLTPVTDSVADFDVLDRQHYVYTRPDRVKTTAMLAQRRASSVVGDGKSLFQLLFPNDLVAKSISSPDNYLWAVVGGRPFEVMHDGAPFIPDPASGLGLAPDGGSVVAAVPIAEVPRSWEMLYPPPFPSDPYRIHAGRQHPEWARAYQYVRIDLQTYSVQSLTDAPISKHVGLWASAYSGPKWSSDGKAVLLPGTFIKSQRNIPSRPCVAIVDLIAATPICVEMLKGHSVTGTEEGFHDIQEARFAEGDKRRILVRFRLHTDFYSIGTTEYQLTANGLWRVVAERGGPSDLGHDGLEISVKEGLNEPPLLVASSKRKSRIILDPNPQLNNIELGHATVYEWKDSYGRKWKGGLFRPRDYKLGQHYPLVIQTHGFAESRFISSGRYPTAFAARALASEGILVLQVADLEVCLTQTSYEGSCAVSGYEAAAKQLVSEGMVDPDKIGIVGWSRTCFYTMQSLVFGSLRFKAASITDGLMEDYFQYLLETDWLAKDSNAVIGAEPFGEGLQQWLERSPGFNLDKINAPLMIVGLGPLSTLHMWAPYAGLRYLHKPVDLVVLNTDEHILTNPALRMASEAGTVDWFRFWLQDYEDPDPAKAEQYSRWNGLRKLQRENDESK
jgi:dipeptidyl aminopeptidase/acylaminoacyl peptidase